MLIDFVRQLLFAVLVGALPGIEREHLRKKIKDKSIPIFGIRTIILFSVLGFISAHLGTTLGESGLFVFGILITIIISTVVYLTNFWKHKHTGATTYASVFLVFFMGFLVGLGTYTHLIMASVLSIILTLLLTARRGLIDWSRRLKGEEIFSAIKFGIIAVIILPLLPNRYVDLWNLINPYSVWYIIVLISVIFFASYIFMKMFSEKGLFYSTFFAGLISGTGTVYQLACRLKRNKTLLKTILSCIFLASFASLFSHLVVIAFVFGAFELFLHLIIPYSIAMVFLMIIFYYFFKKSRKDDKKEIELDSPLSLKSVFTFGGIYLSLVVIGGLLSFYFGDFGLVPAVAGASLFSSSAATASLANLFHQGNITLQSATGFVIFSAIISLLIRILWVWPTKNKKLIKTVTIGTSASSAVLLITYIIQFYFLAI